MKNTRKSKKKAGWENRELGASEKHTKKVSRTRELAVDEQLGLQTISIRLQKSLINDLKKLATADGIGYQPYIRQILMRHIKQTEMERKHQITHTNHVPRTR